MGSEFGRQTLPIKARQMQLARLTIKNFRNLDGTDIAWPAPARWRQPQTAATRLCWSTRPHSSFATLTCWRASRRMWRHLDTCNPHQHRGGRDRRRVRLSHRVWSRLMPSIRVPSPFEPVLTAFAMLSPRSSGRVTKAVEALPAFTPLRRVAEAIETSLPKNATHISGVDLAVALQSAARQTVDPSLMSDGIVASVDKNLPDTRREAVRRNLTRLLTAESIITLGKADDVITDHAKVFSRARILTDIRPVFRDDAAEVPTAAVIVDMLKIEHWARDGSGRQNFYVALDHADLLQLKQVVDRALEKTETLRRLLASTGMSYYEHQEISDAASPDD
jgi:hypothetical protein